MNIHKKILQYTLLFCLIVFFGCKAKQKPSKATGPKLLVDESQQYSPLVFPGDSHTFKFKLTNAGSDILKILDIKKSCGCISLKLPNKEIQPGKSEILNLKVSQDHYGLVSQRVLLTTNEPHNQNLHKLTATTEIIPKFVCNPNKIIEELYPGQTKQRIIDVVVLVDAMIKNVQKSADWISSLVHKVGNGNQIIVNLSAKSLKSGEYQDSIIVHTTFDGLNQIRIPIHLIVKPIISVIPKFLFLGNITRDTKRKPRFITVSVSEKPPKKITVTVVPHNLLSYNIVEESNCARIYIHLIDQSFVGIINGDMQIQIQGSPDVVKIPITGYVAEPHNISNINPNSKSSILNNQF